MIFNILLNRTFEDTWNSMEHVWHHVWSTITEHLQLFWRMSWASQKRKLHELRMQCQTIICWLKWGIIRQTLWTTCVCSWWYNNGPKGLFLIDRQNTESVTDVLCFTFIWWCWLSDVFLQLRLCARSENREKKFEQKLKHKKHFAWNKKYEAKIEHRKVFGAWKKFSAGRFFQLHC